MEEIIYAQASPHSIAGKSLFSSTGFNENNVSDYYSDKKVVNKAVSKLKKAGFEVHFVAKTSISISGKKSLYEQFFGKKITKESKKVRGSQDEETSIDYYKVGDGTSSFLATDTSPFADVIEGIAIAEEPIYFGSAYAPTKNYWHLRVPGDVSMGLNADLVHRTGNTGLGIRVTMVDTGWQSHPYFTQRGYRVLPTLLGPGATNAAVDPIGHGTGESANIFAAAPDVTFRMVKTGNDSVGAFNIAANTNPRPHIISCSWGWSVQAPNQMTAYHQTMASAIAAAVAQGIIVVFAAGNGHFGFPGQHPLVISVGGVYKTQNGANTASNYASGFLSQVYPGRRVPDISGLVGQSPGARYIMLPIPDGCAIDIGAPGGTHPNGDETAPNDGWAAFSGTSAAAPQIAGVCALMKKKRSSLTPAQAKTILMNTATDVTTGSCYNRPGMNHSATVGHDLATGKGLVNAFLAVQNT